ncbi:MAG: DsbA family oxidoreductase [Cypionkella sp.]
MQPPSTFPTLILVSDTICPWCFVGKRRLETALAVLAADGQSFDVEWRAFQLNPDMPTAGMERSSYRAAKFGSVAKGQALDNELVEVGRDVGIGFRYDLIKRTPNTVASHVMIADALRAGGAALQDRAVEALFQAYFLQGRDIGRGEVLHQIAQQVGFDHDPAANPGLARNVAAQDIAARRAGIRGVPSVLLGDHFLFSGAQPPDVIVRVLRLAVEAATAG